MKNFESIDHTADTGFRAYGKTLEEAFENAGLALTEIYADSEKVTPSQEVEISVSSEDLKALLYDWLDELIYLHDGKDLIASEFTIDEILEVEGGYELHGIVGGEDYDSDKHGQRAGVKAMTYHMMKIGNEEDHYFVQVIVDI